jgi:hypothetical protein
MNNLTSFRVGEIYTNDQIRFSLDLENLGGIRPALDERKNVRHVAIMTAGEEAGKLQHENPYRDRIEGDILTYTAQGREGEQQLAGRNKRLIEQYTVPTPFYGFINLGKQSYRFLGLLELLRHYQEMQADRRGDLRKVWVFEFRIHASPEVVPISEATALSASLISESRRQNPLVDLEREVTNLTPEAERETSEVLANIERVRMQLLQFDPYDFEHFIKRVMEKCGFINVSVTPCSGDGGVDVNGFVNETDEFFSGTHVQAQVKRWRHAVGSPDINGFRGALSTTAKGVFITTSHFTRAAVAEARHQSKPSIALIDGDKLSGLVLKKSIPLSL